MPKRSVRRTQRRKTLRRKTLRRKTLRRKTLRRKRGGTINKYGSETLNEECLQKMLTQEEECLQKIVENGNIWSRNLKQIKTELEREKLNSERKNKRLVGNIDGLYKINQELVDDIKGLYKINQKLVDNIEEEKEKSEQVKIELEQAKKKLEKEKENKGLLQENKKTSGSVNNRYNSYLPLGQNKTINQSSLKLPYIEKFNENMRTRYP